MSQNTPKKQAYKSLERAEEEFDTFVKKGRKKLFELETLTSLQEIADGRGKTYKSAAQLMRSIKENRNA